MDGLRITLTADPNIAFITLVEFADRVTGRIKVELAVDLDGDTVIHVRDVDLTIGSAHLTGTMLVTHSAGDGVDGWSVLRASVVLRASTGVRATSLHRAAVVAAIEAAAGEYATPLRLAQAQVVDAKRHLAWAEGNRERAQIAYDRAQVALAHALESLTAHHDTPPGFS